MKKLLPLFALALLAGCPPEEIFEYGQKGKVAIVASGPGTIQTTPLAVGIDTTVRIAGGARFDAVSSTDASVLTVSRDAGSLIVHGVAVGHADIVFYERQVEIDRFSVSTAAIASLSRPGAKGTVPVIEGSEVGVDAATPRDANQQAFYGAISVAPTASGELHATSVGNYYTVDGDGTLRWEAGDLHDELAITSVPASAVTRVLLTSTSVPWHAWNQKNVDNYDIYPSFFAGNDALWGGTCAWSSADGTIVQATQPAAWIGEQPSNYVTLQVPAGSHLSVTCTVGTASATLLLGQ